jgi:hypothetical protein
MSNRLQGKRAFVTAAAAGIGRACALAFAREGATVFATDLDDRALPGPADGIAETARLDVRDTAAVTALAQQVGPVDILLNAAGFVHHGTILDCSEQDWDFSFCARARRRSATPCSTRRARDCATYRSRRRACWPPCVTRTRPASRFRVRHLEHDLRADLPPD